MTETEFKKFSQDNIEFHKTYRPAVTKTEDIFRFEYNLVNGEIDVKLDEWFRDFVENGPEKLDWKWYAQGTDLTKNPPRRDICYERVWLVPGETDDRV
ncbi:MAG: hypothetical protein ACYSTS_19400 [Planctomycetota bacterium]|jgi:hypothetical protein